MASAAYWVASQADQVVATPSSIMGSIGVWSLHLDHSREFDKAGITPTFVFAGSHKINGNPFQPLSEVARAEWQKEVNTIHASFIADVAMGRNMAPTTVRSSFGNGRTFMAVHAVSLGMADEIAILDDVVGELAQSRSRRRAVLSRTREQRSAAASRGRQAFHLAAPQDGHGVLLSFQVARDRERLRLTELQARA